MSWCCFRAGTLAVKEAEAFKPVEGYAEGEWYVTQNSASFGYPDRVAAKDVAWAVEDGAKPMASFSVKA